MIALTARRDRRRSPAGSVVAPPGVDPAAVVVDGPVVTDSREAGPGGLFVARGRGARRRARLRRRTRVERGAVAALVTRPVEGVPCVVVADVQDAFAAARPRGRASPAGDLHVVGITGSSGKTSTKDLLGTGAGHGRADRRPGGLATTPRSACRSPSAGSTADTRFLVVEMGARGIGHVDYLTRIAPPDVGVVLNVGTAHVGEFGAREAIATRQGRARRRRCRRDGLAVLNADDPRCAAMASRDHRPGSSSSARPTTPTCAPPTSRLDAGGRASFTVHAPAGQPAPCTWGCVGRAPRRQRPRGGRRRARARHVARRRSCAALESAARPVSRWRMEVVERADGVTVVNDAYNANPDSMRAALKALARDGARGAAPGRCSARCSSSAPSPTPRTREVGGRGRRARCRPSSSSSARPRRRWPPGRATPARHPASRPPACGRCRTPTRAEALLDAELRPGDVVLFKSSRDAGLRLLGDRLARPSEELT